MINWLPSRAIALSHIVVFCIVFAVTCNGLVITAPTWDDIGRLGRREQSGVATNTELQDLKVRIRSTTEADLPEISCMLAEAILEGEGDHHHNADMTTTGFFPPLNFELRNMRNSVKSLLESRMKATTSGHKYMVECLRTGALEGLSEADKLRLLWSNDTFRNHIEKAASLSNEPHIWKDHNFVCAPQSFDWLFHKMITAENTQNGEVIGFCEVSMLSKPSDETSQPALNGRMVSEDECILYPETEILPTIMNLVTSPKYRRRGLGSTMIGSATKYIQMTSKSPIKDEIALYVEERNSGAIDMYHRLGFETKQRLDSNSQLYMSRKNASFHHNREIAVTKVLRN